MRPCIRSCSRSGSGFFGTSEFAARSFSVLCGIATVVLIYQIGSRRLRHEDRALAAWLAALSPILIVYSREARMYAWLVLVTCLCWRLLLALASLVHRGQGGGVRLLPDRPGLFAPAWSLDAGGTRSRRASRCARQAFGRRAMRWLAIHVAATILILPWIGSYFDHPPEFLSDRLPLRFLLGTPIGFIGGNARAPARARRADRAGDRRPSERSDAARTASHPGAGDLALLADPSASRHFMLIRGCSIRSSARRGIRLSWRRRTLCSWRRD